MTYRIALVCLGNICRSPMAHVVLEDRLARAGLDDRVEVASSGTGDWHVGHPMDPRAAATLSAAGYDPTRHRARTFSPDWYAENDLLLTLDTSNYADVVDHAPTVEQAQQVHMFREFDPEATDRDVDVPDPYYGAEDGFAEVLAMIERTADELVTRLPDLMDAERAAHHGVTSSSWHAWQGPPPGRRHFSGSASSPPRRSRAVTSARPPGCG